MTEKKSKLYCEIRYGSSSECKEPYVTCILKRVNK